jgi:hypothetical protein
MAYQNGAPIYAIKNITAIAAKKERISPTKNIYVDWGSDADLLSDANKKQLVIPIYGDLDQGFTLEGHVFPAVGLIGNATGRTAMLGGQLYHEVKINLEAGIRKRTRHYNFLGIEKAGTYKPFSTEGWFLDGEIADSKIDAEAAYKAVKVDSPINGLVPGLVTGTVNENDKNTTTIIVVVSAVFTIGITLLLTLGKKKKTK